MFGKKSALYKLYVREPFAAGSREIFRRLRYKQWELRFIALKRSTWCREAVSLGKEGPQHD